MLCVLIWEASNLSWHFLAFLSTPTARFVKTSDAIFLSISLPSSSVSFLSAGCLETKDPMRFSFTALQAPSTWSLSSSDDSSRECASVPNGVLPKCSEKNFRAPKNNYDLSILHCA
ncbi:hypothetical protein DPMN_037653 [Dreissena polymorpha]|uniref:Uncharacterized protein n=1 Tax=Dreissena polymorpha TaxID=45954 RepID=A0A9D4RQ06_DREPO|nr:hypothetical protein DPMN_037653 [Dreissena polymorpha]